MSRDQPRARPPAPGPQILQAMAKTTFGTILLIASAASLFSAGAETEAKKNSIRSSRRQEALEFCATAAAHPERSARTHVRGLRLTAPALQGGEAFLTADGRMGHVWTLLHCNCSTALVAAPPSCVPLCQAPDGRVRPECFGEQSVGMELSGPLTIQPVALATRQIPLRLSRLCGDCQNPALPLQSPSDTA